MAQLSTKEEELHNLNSKSMSIWAVTNGGVRNHARRHEFLAPSLFVQAEFVKDPGSGTNEAVAFVVLILVIVPVCK